MGAKRVVAAIADAGPIIHLAEIEALSFFCVFDPLHVTDAVWQETVGCGRVSRCDFLSLNVVKRYEPIQETKLVEWTQKKKLEHLHNGEQESLFLCQEIAVPIILTDDLAVRDSAKKLSFTPVGSLGVVIRAYRNGLILHSDAERYIRDLQEESSLFVTSVIVELALERLRFLVG